MPRPKTITPVVRDREVALMIGANLVSIGTDFPLFLEARCGVTGFPNPRVCYVARDTDTV